MVWTLRGCFVECGACFCHSNTTDEIWTEFVEMTNRFSNVSNFDSTFLLGRIRSIIWF